MSYQSKHTGAAIDSGIDAANAALPRSGGTMTGALILNADPTSDLGAATKKYVDGAVKNVALTPGRDGKSAYEIALEEGFEGSESEWLASLKGEDGVIGRDGEPGEDGVSPTVEVETISGGHKVTITDAHGEQSFNVMNGVDGSGDGSGDMLKAVYDSNNNGMVDDAEKLGGKTPDQYASAEHTHTETDPTVPTWAKESDVGYEVSGNPITLNNYAHMPMDVVTILEPQQEGSGEPSPSNIRPITGYDALELNHHGADGATLKKYSVQLGQNVYGGKFDWTSGKLTMDYGFCKLDGTVKPYEANVIDEFTRAGFNVLQFVAMDYVSDNRDGAFSHGQYRMSWGNRSTHAYANGYTVIIIMPTALVGSTIDSFAEYLTAQDAAGTPVQIAYKLATPIENQFDPNSIEAVHGVNTLYGDGVIRVSGRKDPYYLIDSLVKRIEALESQN